MEVLSEHEVINLILSLNPAVDVQYMNQKLKVMLVLSYVTVVLCYVIQRSPLNSGSVNSDR